MSARPGARVPGRVTVGIFVDATATRGVGHAMRCLALTEELQRRGATVVVLGTLEIGWIAGLYADRDVTVYPAPADAAGIAGLASWLGLDYAVLDGYWFPADLGTALRAAGCRVLAISDGSFGAGQDADVYLDQNFGATGEDLPTHGIHLVGQRYSLFRDAVLDRRKTSFRASEPPTVLAVFGGTDPYHAADLVVPLLLATGAPCELTVVSRYPETAAAIGELPLAPGQRVQVLPSTVDLPALAAASDAVISAAGTSVWEMLCLGVPTAIVCVVDNQEIGYTATVDAGIVLAGGRLRLLRDQDPAELASASAAYRRLLTDPTERDRLARGGQALFDGLGRVRVVDALLG